MAGDRLHPASRKALAEYGENVLRHMDPLARRAHLAVLRPALDTFYGPTIRRYVEIAARSPQFGSGLAGGNPVSADVAVQGIDLLAEAALQSQGNFQLRLPGVTEYSGFKGAIKRLQRDVVRGKIRLMPEQYAMTVREGQAQVSFADEAFGNRDDDAQRLMAAWNYAIFTGKTMCSGMDLVAGRVTNLREWSERGLQESMPHLVISNMGIGEAFGAINKAASKIGIPVWQIDIGSGSGTTIGGSFLGLIKAAEMGAKLDPRQLGVVGVEVTVPMFDQLNKFGQVAINKLNQALGSGEQMSLRTVRSSGSVPVKPGELLLVNGDAAKSVAALEFPDKTDKGGLKVVTANYSWHRLPTDVKGGLIKSVLQGSDDVIFLIADLAQNGSVVNRRYFNFRDNGLLNCGNIHLGYLWRTNGLASFELNENNAPSNMDPRLARRLSEGTTSDSFFQVAFKGPIAQEIVSTW